MRSLGQHHLRWQRALRLSSSRLQLHSQLRQCGPSTQLRFSHSQQAGDTTQQTALKDLTAKWQPHWDRLAPQWHTLRTADKGKAYVLPMFPYPSGVLHLGHLRVYTISDVLSRFKHMQGYDVLHPIGWDAFGLPAENAAIERGIHPEKWTLQNIDAMKDQMKVMGGRWDWDKEFRTCDPEFYKHNQRIFLMLHQRGLAYRAESLVNYDPVDKTVLANEQVDANGCSWRSGAKVEKLMLKQWFLKIKEFQEPLLQDLEALAVNGNWPEKVLAMQKNWLGRSEGTKLRFEITSPTANSQPNPVDVFTTRADTLFGVQYIALSLNHPIVQDRAKEDEALQAFIKRAKDLPPDSKEGYLIPNLVAKNPVASMTGKADFDASVPVYVAPYVLDDYGSGAVMGVPGHDTRDHAFWRANAGDKPIKMVIVPEAGQSAQSLVPHKGDDKPVTEKGFVASNCVEFSGLHSDEAANALVEQFKLTGQSVEKIVNWRLRDWLISRQRYWGTPIPIIHCNTCGEVPVPERDLPVELPKLPDSFFQGRTGNPLAEDAEWKNTTCPKCGSAAERETDTMDTFMDSSWYFFRFLDPRNKDSPVDLAKADQGMPVDIYVGGVEHAILHLLYARFISKFLATTTHWPKGQLVKGEPFKKLLTQGMVHGKTYSDPETGRFLKPQEVDLSMPAAPIIKSTGATPTISYEKMSKSKYNGVDPGATIATYGADATRAHMLFQAPVSDVLEWDETKISGVLRWLQRVIRLSGAFWYPKKELPSFNPPRDVDILLDELLETIDRKRPVPRGFSRADLISSIHPHDAALWTKTQQTIASITQSYSETYTLNTVISDLMTLTNTIWDAPHASYNTPWLKWLATTHLLRMLAPVAPGVAEEGWHLLRSATGTKIGSDRSHPLHETHVPSIFALGFPVADTAILPSLNSTTKCVFQVEGKKKFEVAIAKIPATITKHEISAITRWVLKEIMTTEEGKDWLDRSEGKIWKVSGTQEEHKEFDVVPKGWKVIIAKKGGICNLVGPKKRKQAEE